MAFVTTYQQLAVLRTLLGLLESGFFPGCESRSSLAVFEVPLTRPPSVGTFLIATWYKKYETGKRMVRPTLLGAPNERLD